MATHKNMYVALDFFSLNLVAYVVVLLMLSFFLFFLHLALNRLSQIQHFILHILALC